MPTRWKTLHRDHARRGSFGRASTARGHQGLGCRSDSIASWRRRPSAHGRRCTGFRRRLAYWLRTVRMPRANRARSTRLDRLRTRPARRMLRGFRSPARHRAGFNCRSHRVEGGQEVAAAACKRPTDTIALHRDRIVGRPKRPYRMDEPVPRRGATTSVRRARCGAVPVRRAAVTNESAPPGASHPMACRSGKARRPARTRGPRPDGRFILAVPPMAGDAPSAPRRHLAAWTRSRLSSRIRPDPCCGWVPARGRRFLRFDVDGGGDDTFLSLGYVDRLVGHVPKSPGFGNGASRSVARRGRSPPSARWT